MRKLLILAVFVCGAVCAHANPVEFEFLAWNDGNWQNGYPYYIEEVGGDNTVIMAMCDDYAHSGMPGDKWMANITNLGTGNITLTRFNIASAATDLYPLNLYDAAGWLLLETEQEPMERWLPINQAIWNIFDSQAPCDKTCEDWESVAFGAIKSLPQSYYDNVYIVTPVNPHDPNDQDIQEFMYIGKPLQASATDQQKLPVAIPSGNNCVPPETRLLTTDVAVEKVPSSVGTAEIG